MTTPGDGDPYESVIFQADTGAGERLMRSLAGLHIPEGEPSEQFGWVMEAMNRPAPGYKEIANADGIRWHERINPDDDDPR